MKILYINPPKIESGMDAVIKGAPLSLISIAGAVPDHDAELFDFKVDKYREKRFRRALNRTDVVAMSSMTPQIYQAFNVSEMAKEHGCTTIMGGYHPTLAPKFVAQHPAVDYTVRGEGENTFRELIDFIDSNKNHVDIKEIDGISYKNKNGEVIHNKERLLEANLDNLPMPRRDLLKGKLYSYIGTKTQQVETSRGCPHNCKFCCIIKMWSDSTNRMRYRTKSIKRIMQEVYEVDLSNNNFIFFCEDNFTINVKRTKKICETIIRSGVNNKIHFSCQSRIDTLYQNPWLIKLMRKAGFRQLFLGIESVHQQSLDAMNKRNLTPAMARTVVEMLRSEGISIFGGMIIGFPGETKTMVRQNIQYAKSLNLDVVQFTPITAFPGTSFHDEMKSKGMVKTNNYKYYNLFYPMMRTDELSLIEMWNLVAEAYAAFYLNGDWIRARGKEYLNPLSKFNWMLKSIFRLIKQGIKSGYSMFHNQGISHHIISDELIQIIAQAKIEKENNKLKPEIKTQPLIQQQEKAISSAGH